MLTESLLNRRLDHPNVMKMIGTCLPPDPLCIVFELLSKGCLDNILMDPEEEVNRDSTFRFYSVCVCVCVCLVLFFLREMMYDARPSSWSVTFFFYLAHRAFNFVGRYRFCLDIAHGLKYLHDLGLIHSDLKPQNILVSEDDVCKVSLLPSHLFLHVCSLRTCLYRLAILA